MKIGGLGELQDGMDPTGRFMDFPRDLQVMPWDREEWATSEMRPRCANCSQRKELAQCEPRDEYPKDHPMIRMRWNCTNVFCSGDKSHGTVKPMAAGVLEFRAG